jgi:hypothetical protein
MEGAYPAASFLFLLPLAAFQFDASCSESRYFAENSPSIGLEDCDFIDPVE